VYAHPVTRTVEQESGHVNVAKQTDDAASRRVYGEGVKPAALPQAPDRTNGDGDAAESFEAFATRLSSGEEDAAAELLATYSSRLFATARRQLGHRLAGKSGPEDIVQSVMRTFFRRLGSGEVELRDWSSLSGLLSLLTIRKCAVQGRRYSTKARSVSREVSLQSGEGCELVVPDRDPTPDEVVTFVDLVETLLSQSSDQERLVLERLLGGSSIAEVAAEIGRTERTVFRILERVRGRVLHSGLGRDDE
jgi:RNA polymerase sigma-70 factor (ECF subfamily)